jgi:CheY-like chemotaxis protein
VASGRNEKKREDQRRVADMPTILLVDDDEVLLDSLRALLVSHGYATAEANDGEQALDYLRDNPSPCLILLDLMMPRMNGWEFLTHKARDDKLAAVPVVITSGTEANLPTHVAAIRKPWNIENLLILVRRYSSPAT